MEKVCLVWSWFTGKCKEQTSIPLWPRTASLGIPPLRQTKSANSLPRHIRNLWSSPCNSQHMHVISLREWKPGRIANFVRNMSTLRLSEKYRHILDGEKISNFSQLPCKFLYCCWHENWDSGFYWHYIKLHYCNRAKKTTEDIWYKKEFNYLPIKITTQNNWISKVHVLKKEAAQAEA